LHKNIHDRFFSGKNHIANPQNNRYPKTIIFLVDKYFPFLLLSKSNKPMIFLSSYPSKEMGDEILNKVYCATIILFQSN